MSNILININVTSSRLDDFLRNILPIMDLKDPEIFMKATIIGDIPKLDICKSPNLEIHQVFVDPPTRDRITNRQGRIGNLMDYRFSQEFSSMFLMDDDMQITSGSLFLAALHEMDRLINLKSLAFIKTTTHPVSVGSKIQSNIGWPWMANGIMVKWFEFKCPDYLMDEWFFLDDFIIMKAAVKSHGYRFAQYNYPVGVIHYTSTDAHTKGIIVPKNTCAYLSDRKLTSHTKFDQEFIELYSKYFNALNNL